ncbi:MAG: DUF4982 domain-containing protein [Oscillospiraceae bacterium]|nr:DUF4982 domain-containing protein [Oscillospiraceae bacterium]
MKKTCFSKGWSFTFKGSTGTVDLPHDFSIIQRRDPKARSGASNGFFPGGVADYSKNLLIPESARGRRFFLEFEGAYMNATVRVNQSIAAFHPYGYTSFTADVTPYIRYGSDNAVTVNVSNDALPNTRWYSGSGLYRPVWLMEAGPAYIPNYGVFVTTPDLGTVEVETTVRGEVGVGSEITVKHAVHGDSGVLASFEGRAGLSGGECRVRLACAVPGAKAWSVDEPNMHRLVTELIVDGEVADTASTLFGFRTVSMGAKDGFKLNGVPMKMKGGCVHHDCGILGAAAYARAEERKVELLKASGYDAVRCAHNPPSVAFLDACDRLGMLVMDESFDMWREQKTAYDYHLHFESHWKGDMASMILRDRNHPSVVIWSTGNEIMERDGRSDGYRWARELADYARSLDHTRPVTNALCANWHDVPLPEDEAKAEGDLWARQTRGFAEPLDVVGYNYLRDRYEGDGALYPERAIIGTETFPKEAFDNWEATKKYPHVLGDFVWTAWDYLGEAGIGRVRYGGDKGFCGAYPWNQAYCGDIDVCGFKRPQSYYRDFVWGIGDAPYIAVYKPDRMGGEADISAWGWPDVAHSWTWPGYEGKTLEVEVYCGGEEVTLSLNGRLMGRRPSGKACRYMARFSVPYEPGLLEATVHGGGAALSSGSLRTAGPPASIRLTPDRRSIDAGGDLSFIAVELLDADGNMAHGADAELHFTVSGAGSLLAVGNGDPASEEMYVGAVRRAHQGRAMAVIKSGGCAGEAVLCASAEGIRASSVLVTVK